MNTGRSQQPAVELGIRQQPAVAARARRLLVLLSFGLLFSLMGLVSALMASRTLLRFEQTSRLWPMVGNLASVLLTLVCAGQWYVWRQAQLEWIGAKDVSLIHLLAPSAVGRWVAMACGVAGPVACLQMIRETAPADAAHRWAIAGGLAMILAMAFGGIHQFNPAGPRGVLPQRLRNARVVTSDGEVHVDPEADTVILRREHAQPGSGESAD